jgi:phosphoribosylglycinamide formyltransferase 1
VQTAPSPERIAVFASGAGSTFEHLVDCGRAGEIAAEVVLLITSRHGTGAAERAATLGVEYVTLDEQEIGREVCDAMAYELLTSRAVGLVVLAGHLRRIGPRTLAAYQGRIINTHPGPLPRFGGRGMYGLHVHRAVLDAGVAASAATIHLVDAGYDTGPVIAERPVPVHPDDTPESLRDRVQEAERSLLTKTINDLVAARTD